MASTHAHSKNTLSTPQTPKAHPKAPSALHSRGRYTRMASAHGYEYVYSLEMGSHAFFVRRDLLHPMDWGLPLKTVKKASARLALDYPERLASVGSAPYCGIP